MLFVTLLKQQLKAFTINQLEGGPMGDSQVNDTVWRAGDGSTLKDGNGEGVRREQLDLSDKEGGSDRRVDKTDIEKQADELRERLDTLKCSISYLGNMEEALRKSLLEKGDPRDAEYREIAEKVKRLQENLREYSGQSEEVRQKLSTLMEDVQAEIRTLSDAEVARLKTITNKEFLNVPDEKRLQYVTKNHIDSADISSGVVKNIEFTFTYDGQFNKDLYLRTTAGQVLPDEVASVLVNGEKYLRTSIDGEFFNSSNKRLTIHENTKLEVTELRDITKIKTENTQKVNSYLEEHSDANKDIVTQAVTRGINPEFATKVFSTIYEKLPESKRQAALEDMMTEFDRVVDSYSVDKVSAYEDYPNDFEMNMYYKYNQQGRKQQAEQAGISTKEIQQYEESIGTKFVEALAASNYPTYRNGAYCGFNCRAAIESKLGIDLPDSGMDGYNWDNVLDRNPNFISEEITHPNEAKPGGILVYERGSTNGTSARAEYGHVEIALGNGNYYFGNVNSHPGGSANANKDLEGSKFVGKVYYPVSAPKMGVV